LLYSIRDPFEILVRKISMGGMIQDCIFNNGFTYAIPQEVRAERMDSFIKG
jgi:hypothetical protein